MASWNEHLAAMKKLRHLGVGGYVVMSRDGAKAGIPNRSPVGVITSFRDPITVGVRRVGQRSAVAYAAGFWEPAPGTLVNVLSRGEAEEGQ